MGETDDRPFKFRNLSLKDVAFCAALSRDVGWNQDEGVWSRMIELCGRGAFCLVSGERIVATALALTYGTRLAWVGMVLTHPSFQKQGLGRLLMKQILTYCEAAGVMTIMLDATDAGRRLYESIGFRALHRVGTWTRRNETPLVENEEETVIRQPEVASPSEIRIATPDQFDQVIRLDSQLLGVSRPRVIGSIGGTCWVAERGAIVEGYLFARTVVAEHRMGPWYHTDAQMATNLLLHALGRISGLGGEVRLDIPEVNEAAVRIVHDLGFATKRYVCRMTRGAPPPDRMAEQYSVAAFATG
ncbi:MAG TPA: GNAT family N-acetyltransferase [Spirochaetia bacterium]|nr:GNAT family N-acetyltransferase [Spirochaetia bacterium]